MLTEYERMQALELRNNLNAFSLNCLKIKSKQSGIIPFGWSKIQLDAHHRIEMRRRAGKKIKIIFLKSRQVGMSTYTEARLFSNIFWNKAKNAFVMADRSDSTTNIFEMAKRFYYLMPAGMPKPEIKKLNADEMFFKTDSSFRVGTAGSKSVGRSMTNNYLHGSEVAFWENADEIITGLFQTVPDTLDSEIILESTANGVTGKGAFFYSKVIEGLDEFSEWLTLFYAWHQHEEYRTPLIEPIKWDDEELELKRLYNLDDAQLYWRRNKIKSDFKNRVQLFKQEYPSCIQEAFIRSGDSLVNLEYIENAKKNFLSDNLAPIVIGVDPARSHDRTVIVVRQGRVLLKIYRFEKMDEMRLAGIIAKLITSVNADRLFIDYGHGTGCYDRLVEQGLGSKVELVQFGAGALDATKYINRRAEMYDNLRDWFMQQGGVFIADKEYEEELIADLMLIPDLRISDSNGKMSLERKGNIVKGTNINSLDMSDALALTFAAFVPKSFDKNYDEFGNPQNLIIKATNRKWNERM